MEFKGWDVCIDPMIFIQDFFSSQLLCRCSWLNSETAPRLCNFRESFYNILCHNYHNQLFHLANGCDSIIVRKLCKLNAVHLGPYLCLSQQKAPSCDIYSPGWVGGRDYGISLTYLAQQKTNPSLLQTWKSLKKEHWHDFESEKFAQKICAKNNQNRAKTSKNANK